MCECYCGARGVSAVQLCGSVQGMNSSVQIIPGVVILTVVVATVQLILNILQYDIW
jgi:hypothetical protein